MARLRILSAKGDALVTWDTEKAQTGDPEASSAVEEAERIFERERARGSTAFKVEAGKPAERIDRFDPTAEETVIVPMVAGG